MSFSTCRSPKYLFTSSRTTSGSAMDDFLSLTADRRVPAGYGRC
jgi:hypothetical protein